MPIGYRRDQFMSKNGIVFILSWTPHAQGVTLPTKLEVRLDVPMQIDFELPQLSREIAEDKSVVALGVAVVVIVALMISRFTNGWILLVSGLSGPILGCLWFVVSPADPYRIDGGASDSNLAAQLLEKQLRSRGAGWFSLRTAL
jgi:hypothetical protein